MQEQNELATVFMDTIDRYLDPRYRDVPVYRPIVETSESLESIKYEPKYDTPAIVKVLNIDTLDLAKQLIDGRCHGQQPTTPNKVSILNMASDYKPCGGALNGARAQEECIARRSNLFMLLPIQMYPWNSDHVVFNRRLDICKNVSYEDCEPFQLNCISIAGVRKPKLNSQGGYKDAKLHDIMKRKIENIFQVAYKYGQDTLVLGAIGCGAFGNPPYDVAQIFAECIQKYIYSFKNIYFAVLSSNRNENYKIFHTHIEVAFANK